MSAGGYTIIAPFSPSEFQDRGINLTIIGYIFASYSITVIFASLIMDKVIDRIGRKWTIIMGLSLEGFSFIGFGAISYYNVSTIYFIILAFLCRII